MPFSHFPVRQFGVIGCLILVTCQTSNRSSQVLKHTDYECINVTAVFQFASEIVSLPHVASISVSKKHQTGLLMLFSLSP